MQALPEWPATRRARTNKYDYDKMFNGTIWSCERGKDFTCKRLSFEQHMRTRAAERGLKLHVANMPDPDQIVLQATPQK